MTDAADGDLRDRFAALRREDAAGAPSFAATRAATRAAAARRPARRVRLVPLAGAIAVAVALVVTLAVLRTRPRREPLVSLATTRWQSPTDFLLRVPGAQYLETVPRLTL